MVSEALADEVDELIPVFTMYSAFGNSEANKLDMVPHETAGKKR